MAKQLRLLPKDYKPKFLRSSSVRSGIYLEVRGGDDKALDEAQSEELSTNTIQWIEDVLSYRPSEPEVWPATEQPEIDAKDIAESESDSDQSDEEFREQSGDGTKQAKAFVTRSSSLVSYKNKIGATINPYPELDLSLSTNN
ncbi:hypothetical protein LTR91_015332 [Friedmanniomyces endolithicus]|uniref:Uncharacterized protein n=1 Tax=Friedmanniomyces endolithicus TaxID=329885 RepID=A0AAN6KAK1_9PEZI|nr:hypothetical protein LTR59_005470 [Friedmanniomyces endolithicus]KAK0809093.1 hypothetical protein LTR75_006035 [Friedmanniomyces endolithicus]KAK0917980.1 hypothetical protein LTR57_012131 [Friedmanniomyces endolithicus]KAK0971935.1 hypothetical protein LTR91_015332 [Friedmanniomyces endolithicus]KAK0983223.1 hypothetical protein LTS01_011062 [Friedmanniomyces endolithicus]